MLDSEARRPSPEATARSGRILVAEDNPLNQKLFRMILTTEGFAVDLVNNGREAVDTVESNDPYDLILMDLQMPEMDGLEATRLIRRNPKSEGVPIIAVTAYIVEVGKENCLETGMSDYIEKPFRREVILDVLRKWIRA